MARRRRKRHKLLGISDKGWSTIGTGVKWWIISGLVVTGVVIVGAVTLTVVAAKGGLGGAPPVRILT